ncbi:aldo/keto reductase [Algibacillus agarilyticus]|uniref:aldo/keto reductase n=1 Tax=Algibacillus agarilyticus TaxID=2234133 RepID=UPI000DCFAB1F|nr:aldo/keto reductase [Algibacillus agarilyticus]
METRILGKSGLKASVIGLGCWQLGGDFGPQGQQNATAILATADKNQISFWDTADVYGAGLSEKTIGEWQASTPAERTIVTKLGRDDSLFPNKYTRDTMLASIEGSLERLQLNCLDLVQLHCIPPKALQNDSLWQILEDFRSQGLIKHYGASVETIEEGLSCLDKPGLTSLQIIFNLFRQDAITTLLPQAAAADIGIIVRLPLASGLLSGKFAHDTQFSEGDHRHYNKEGEFFNVGETFSGLPFEQAIKLVQQLQTIAPPKLPLAQFALRWLLDQPQVTTVIAGASTPEQVVQNAKAAALKPLSVDLHTQLQTFYHENVRSQVRGTI